MATKLKLSSSYSCGSTHISSSLKDKAKLKLSSRLGCFDCRHLNAIPLKNIKVIKSCQLLHGKIALKAKISKKHRVFFATSEDLESYSDLEEDNLELENEQPSPEGAATEDTLDELILDSGGKSGFVSFYRHGKERKDQTIVSSTAKNQSYLLWFVGPTVLVASFVFPSLYLRRILSTIFEDSLLTDFLILFFTEALFYCGVAVFLLLIDRVRRPMDLVPLSENTYPAPHLSQRISSVAVLVLSLIIPMVTMGFVWPWTGPAASATLAPYLVGIIVQFAFERYAKRTRSPSWPAIPIIFQIYRLHQLNRAAQLVTALSFTVRGAEMTSHNLAINGSLSTLLNVLQFLGIICIWSLSSFVMRYFPSVTIPDP